MGLHPPNEQLNEAAAFAKCKFTAISFCGCDDISPLELEFLENCRRQRIRKTERHKVNRDSIFPVR
jgi:hypothetical protein